MIKINRSQKNDSILILSAVLLLLLSGFLIFQFSSFEFQSKIQPPKIIGKAVLTVDFGNDKKRAFEGDIVNNETFIGVLMQASKAGNFSYKLDEGNNLAEIEKFAADGKKSWRWYLNGKEIDKPLSEIIVKDGDNILIQYD